MPTAAIYARFSCSRQREASIDDQLRVCRAWCADNGYEVVAEYCDRAVSGRTDARPEFQRMMDAAGESDVVVVYMMDRFSRDVYDAPIYKKRLRDAGVRVVSATEALPDGPDALLLEKIYEGLAAVESAHISQRTRRGMEGNALKCLYNGDRVFGYTVDPETRKYALDGATAPLVREMFARRAAGESINSIARAMAAKGVTTYRGKPCSFTMVRNVLGNVRYRGVYRWGDVEVPGGMPAIVTDDEWDAAQRVRPSKVRAEESWDAYPLVGRAVCSCGRGMQGSSGRGRNGRKYRYYRCGGGCGSKAVPADWLESHVADALREFVADRDRALEVGRIVEEYAKSSAAHAQCERDRAEVDECTRALGNIQRAIEQGVFSAGTRERIVELEDRRAAAQARLDASRDYALDAGQFADFLQYGATLDDGALVDLLAWQVVVCDDEVLVALNYDVEPGVPRRVSFAAEKGNTPESEVFAGYSDGSPHVSSRETRAFSVRVVGGAVVLAITR